MSIGVSHDLDTGKVVLVDQGARKIYDVDPCWPRWWLPTYGLRLRQVARFSLWLRPTMAGRFASPARRAEPLERSEHAPAWSSLREIS